MKMFGFAILGLGLVLSASVTRAQTADDVRGAQCAALYPPATHYLDRAKCEEPVRRRSMQDHGTEADMIDAFLLYRRKVSSDIDKGRLTVEDANVKLSEERLRLNRLVADRVHKRALTAARILSLMQDR